MPLHDHFNPPVTDHHSWDSFHGGWPMMIVRQLFEILPAGYVSAPTVHFGKEAEIDVAAFAESSAAAAHAAGNGALATTSPAPTLTLEADLPDQDAFEVRVYKDDDERQLVAAIEIVSPANKDRPESRASFVTKVASLLHRDVCVSIVDLVSNRHANLYAELLDLIGYVDPQVQPNRPNLYSVTIRSRQRAFKRSLLDMWYYPMSLGQPLPTLPIWLSPDLRVLLPLEPGYEETCRLLHIA